MLSIQDVGFRYGNRQVLKKINIQLQKGETVAIIGPSGVGKTTLFNLIAGIIDAQQGQIELDGSKEIKGKIVTCFKKICCIRIILSLKILCCRGLYRVKARNTHVSMR